MQIIFSFGISPLTAHVPTFKSSTKHNFIQINRLSLYSFTFRIQFNKIIVFEISYITKKPVPTFQHINSPIKDFRKIEWFLRTDNIARNLDGCFDRWLSGMNRSLSVSSLFAHSRHCLCISMSRASHAAAYVRDKLYWIPLFQKRSVEVRKIILERNWVSSVDRLRHYGTDKQKTIFNPTNKVYTRSLSYKFSQIFTN